MNLLQEKGQQGVVNNPAIPNEFNNEVLGEAGNSIMSGLQQTLAGGGLTQIMSMFGQGGSGGGIASLLSNPMVQNMVQSFTGKLTSQYNVDPAHAQQVSSSLIPDVLSGFAGKVADQNDTSIDINGVMQSLAGGNAGGIDFQGILNKFQGQAGDANGDGNVDLSDIMAKLSGGGGGGVVDMLKGFLK